MAAILSQYPSAGAESFVRGDPVAYIVRIMVEGVDQDITGWEWRSYVRTSWDSDPLTIAETFDVVTPDSLPDLFPGGGATPSVLVVHWTPEQTHLWKAGYVSDVEQLEPNKLTWVIINSLNVVKDASYTAVLP